MMMKAILILTLFLLLASWDIPRLMRNKKKHDLLVYSFLMIMGLFLSILAAFHVYLPIWVQE